MGYHRAGFEVVGVDLFEDYTQARLSEPDRRMLDYAVTCGLLPHNPVSALPMRHVYRAAARDRALTPDEIQLFLRSAQASNIRRQFKIGLHLILLTMVRKSELLLARWAGKMQGEPEFLWQRDVKKSPG